jgi:hypothetical protein
MAVSGMAHPQGRLLAAVCYPLGHPMLYAYELTTISEGKQKSCGESVRCNQEGIEKTEFTKVTFIIEVWKLLFSYEEITHFMASILLIK